MAPYRTKTVKAKKRNDASAPAAWAARPAEFAGRSGKPCHADGAIMTTLNTIASTAASGLYVAQTGLSTVSNNIANLNTPGYVREVVDQVTSAQQGLGSGVSVLGVQRAVNQYLQNASLLSAATEDFKSPS